MLDKPPFARTIPFYQPYALFLRGLHALKQAGVPRRLSHKTMPAMGAKEEPSRFIAGVESLGWINGEREPTDDLMKLVSACGESSWPTVLREVVPKAYSFIPPPWSELTKEKLRAAFVFYVGKEADSIRSAETFFLCLAVEAGFKIPEEFDRKTRIPLAEARRVGATRGGQSDAPEPEVVTTTPNRWTLWLDQILNLTADLEEREMTNKEKDAVLTLISALRRRSLQEEKTTNAA
jgi:hypothetical protein